MAERRVLWSEDAERDLGEIVEYIAHDSPLDALRVFDRLRQQAAKLERFAERGRRVAEMPPDVEAAFREIVVAPWRLIYVISDATVLVVALVDSRRDFDAWLMSRFGPKSPD